MDNSSVEKFIRTHLVNIQTYAAVDPPELLAQKAGIPENKIVKLNGNENPYGGSPRLPAVLATTPTHIYPDPLQRKMRLALSHYTGADPSNIVVGAGADELIDLLFRLFIAPGDRILDFDPTFGMYGFCARIAGGAIQLIQRDQQFDIDLSTVNEAMDKRTKMIFVTSPNNPTGNLLTETQVKYLLDTGRIVVVDEAYFEFCNSTAARLVDEHENLVVLRTMSKWAGLAGLRVGYGIMSPTIVQHLIDIKSPYNVNVAAEAALLCSIEDSAILMKNVRKIIDERERMFSMLQKIPQVVPWPSHGNFLLCQFPPGRAVEIYQNLAERGIFVRNFGSDRLKDFFRASIGTPKQTDSLINAIKELV